MADNLPYPEEIMITVSRNALKIGRDHVADLGLFGLNEAFLNDLENDIQTAESTPSNQSNRMDLLEFTKSKDDVLDDCYLWGRHLKLRMEMAFGKRSQEAAEFPSEKPINPKRICCH